VRPWPSRKRDAAFTRETIVDESEIRRLQTYLRDKFGNGKIKLKDRIQTDGSLEVAIDDEFIGIIYRDEEEGEVSYAFNMAILDIDLAEPG
jgi:hypothetical protein